MALITCPECKKKISEKVAACPKCGNPLTPDVVAAIKKKGTKDVAQGCAGCLVLMLIGWAVMCGTMGKSLRDAHEADKKMQAETATAMEMDETPESHVRHYIIKAMGVKVNTTEKDRIISLTVAEGGCAVYVRANENLSAGWTKQGAVMDARKIFEGIYGDPVCGGIDVVTLAFHSDFTDQYSKVSEGVLGRMMLRRATAEKINWENMTDAGLENLLGSEGVNWWHPSIGK